MPETAGLRIEPIRPDDAGPLGAFHEGLSDRTKELRFFTPHPHLSDAEVHHFTTVDHHGTEALVARAGDRLVGVARYGVLTHDPLAAEVAFVVADEWQGRGVGRALLDALVVRARAEGVHRFVAETLDENAPMIGLFRSSGLEVREEHALGRAEFVLTLHDASAEPLPHRQPHPPGAS